jgi:hypothetical protein
VVEFDFSGKKILAKKKTHGVPWFPPSKLGGTPKNRLILKSTLEIFSVLEVNENTLELL